MVSSKLFDTQVTLVITKELVVPGHAHFDLFRLCCNEHSRLVNSYLFRISRIESPSCSACSHPTQEHVLFCAILKRTLCTTLHLATAILSTTSSPGLVELAASEVPCSLTMPHPSERAGNNNIKKVKKRSLGFSKPKFGEVFCVNLDYPTSILLNMGVSSLIHSKNKSCTT